jgi:hypothetical protein
MCVPPQGRHGGRTVFLGRQATAPGSGVQENAAPGPQPDGAPCCTRLTGECRRSLFSGAINE